MKPTSRSLSLLLFIGACASTDDKGSARLEPDAGADGAGVDASADAVAPPDGCDPNADPKDAPKCVVSEFGIFVDATTGNDGNTGTKELPMKTIGAALTKLNGRPRIYVCEGTYPESVKLTSPISIYGGFACGTWASTEGRAKLAPPTGVPLVVSNTASPVVLQQLEAVASADASAGASAIATIIAAASSVTLRRVMLTAGNGADGALGTSVSNWTGTASKGVNALDGGAGILCTCTNGNTSKGGAGGAIGAGGSKGEADPPVGTPNGGLGGDDCTVGTAGANGVANAGGVASTKAGVLSALGWTGTGDATAGQPGNPAQGGGGGGGKNGAGGGGGGGCGGCGGGGGTAGGNGGSSIALAVFNSRVAIEGGAFSAGTGGAGGIGGDGQAGQAGGGTGAGACNGGLGGNGAGGGGGGGGAGGHSAVVVHVGMAPQITGGATLTPGTFGPGGKGGGAGASAGNPGAVGGSGPDGKAIDILPL